MTPTLPLHRISLRRWAGALVAISLLHAAFAAPASAQEPMLPQPGIRALDNDGDSWFDIELEAGATTQLAVELANHGDQTLAVHSYPADVYTIVNGGMGVRLRDEPITDTGRWLDYAAEVTRLGAEQSLRKTVAVTVPPDTPPGQYIAALVVENDEPVAGTGELSLNQVVRQAIAVNVTVPGPAAPQLSIDNVEHIRAGGRSIVAVKVGNPGNRHLRPAVDMTLKDATGTTIVTRKVTMDGFYAGTATTVELIPDAPLAPGRYAVDVNIRDDEHGVEAVRTLDLEVTAPASVQTTPAVVQAVDELAERAGVASWLVWAGAGVVLLLLVAILAALIGLLRRRGRTGGPQWSHS